MTDSLDHSIKAFFKNHRQSAPGRVGASPPDDEVICAYLRHELSESETRRMDLYLQANPEECDFVERMRGMLGETGQAKGEEVDSRWLEKVKALRKGDAVVALCPHCRGKITPFIRPLAAQHFNNYVLLCAGMICFALSFVFAHYFIQWVAAALFFGIKWAVDGRKTRTQILIYKAMTGDRADVCKDLHRVESDI